MSRWNIDALNVSKIRCNIIFKSSSKNVHQLHPKKAKGGEFWSEGTPLPPDEAALVDLRAYISLVSVRLIIV